MLQEDKLKEECGIFGVYSNKNFNVATMIYYGLCALQHRGEESAGIAVCKEKSLKYYKDMGLVCNVFNDKTLQSLNGNVGIGHVRYSTTGLSEKINAQPILGKFKNNIIAMGHNGNLKNARELRKCLQNKKYKFETSIDSEVILKLVEMNQENKNLEEAILEALKLVKGSYSLAFVIENKLIGVRDPHGIRPLCMGKLGEDYILSSESCAFESLGAEFIRDVEPGEMIVINENGFKSIKLKQNFQCNTCIFEYIYFARPDSIIDGFSVYESRVMAGKKLYEEEKIDADVVLGVPDSGIPAAEGYAEASGIPFKVGFVKNKYVGRTFIVPSQCMRQKKVALKLNPLKSIVKGKRVIVVDDSIVRGNTSKYLVDSIRKAGAKEVHFRVASPIIKYPCYFGISTHNRGELIGANKSVEEIKEFLGVDSLRYLSIDRLISIFNKKKYGFCLGCFNGKYPR
ncbi:amidophosphoribosyltransferase [Hathewaya limosa]|uniref:Amidophosphoribosyltransferase n=1 Tax=Hathewaya limosa TaxID=1536 RepID=A0ABU0JVQ6_HATLI|nr:amidophosphoribosyltransferase [Hathewaya limosa]MDQ0480218.1 amidophosphoribosyltransferase [Hathewaya limosa]